jgi:hypothetical protein
VPISPDIQNAHPFGCPVYVLNSKLQQGQKISQWDARANLGAYLGTSAIHASSVGLVLSLRTGLVSPSFHNAYDDKFVTVSSPFGKYVPKSQWQIKCGFQEDPNFEQTSETIHIVTPTEESNAKVPSTQNFTRFQKSTQVRRFRLVFNLDGQTIQTLYIIINY